jgi:hypothetical protein
MLSPYFYIVGQDPRAERDRAETLAVLGLEVVGAVDLDSVRVARELTAALRAHAASGPYTIAPNSDQELIDLKLIHDCPDERKACMAKIGRALHTKHLLYGHVERKSGAAGGRGYQVSLRLLNVDDGQLGSWTSFIPASETSGTKLAEWGRRGHEQLLVSSRPETITDRVLVDATNHAFWQVTRHKPGQPLDMSNPRDRAMSKTWLNIYAQIRARRTRATDLARHVLNETITPYILVIEQHDGSLTHRTFERRSSLDVQYSWVVDQPKRYTYLAMFDFTKNRDAPILDQFAISKRQHLATSGWYG